MTPRYYAIRINAHESHDTLEGARKEAESLPLGIGDEWGILELVGITRRSVTTTWLDKRDIGGACEQATSHPTTPIDGWTSHESAGEFPISSAMRDLAGTVGKALGAASTPWSWPILPPGHSYLNPENLTVGQLGDGWRPLCTLDGDVPRDSQVYLQCAWDHSGLLGKTWLRNCYVTNVHRTYRTRAPIPTLQ
jgi:hypothetical protein